MRILAENPDFVIIAPYAPRFPFEIWILPKRHDSATSRMPENANTRISQAILQTSATQADRVLDFPAYNSGHS